MKGKFLYKCFFAIVLIVAGVKKLNAQPASDKAEIENLRVAIEKNPDDLALHEKYLKASGYKKWGTPEFVAQYEAWMKKFPKSATVAYAFGHSFVLIESPKAKPYLLKAVALKPKFDKAYIDLSADAQRWGDFKAADDYLLKAKEIDSKNADYAFNYGWSFKDSNPGKYKQLSLDVAKDFPNTETGAKSLYWLAYRTTALSEKTSYYEQLRKDFPADKFGWSSSGMSDYFNLLLIQSPIKSLNLAKYMISLKPVDDLKNWQSNKTMAAKILQVDSFMTNGKAVDAALIMEKLVIPRYSSAKEGLLLLKAKVIDASGQTEKAYQSLVVAFAKEPIPAMENELAFYGAKLGKNEMQVNQDLWYTRDTASKIAPVFVLDEYLKKGTVSLANYKGKVVLLTYWFPGCGPCRSEFPHFENVVKKFKGKKFVYLGINIEPGQDAYVLPFIKTSGYSFIPLRDNKNWEKGPLDNHDAAPENFLIDGNGKIIFSRFNIDFKNEATLERMISSILKRQKNR